VLGGLGRLRKSSVDDVMLSRLDAATSPAQVQQQQQEEEHLK
jgi:hypothetical protein